TDPPARADSGRAVPRRVRPACVRRNRSREDRLFRERLLLRPGVRLCLLPRLPAREPAATAPPEERDGRERGAVVGADPSVAALPRRSRARRRSPRLLVAAPPALSGPGGTLRGGGVPRRIRARRAAPRALLPGRLRLGRTASVRMARPRNGRLRGARRRIRGGGARPPPSRRSFAHRAERGRLRR